MREFIRSDSEIKDSAIVREEAIEAQQLDVLRVVYYVFIQYRKFKSALRCLAILLTFDPEDELALLATAYCYFSLKRYRKTVNLLKSMKGRMKSQRARDMFEYIQALTLTEMGNTKSARRVYKNVAEKQKFVDRLEAEAEKRNDDDAPNET